MYCHVRTIIVLLRSGQEDTKTNWERGNMYLIKEKESNKESRFYITNNERVVKEQMTIKEAAAWIITMMEFKTELELRGEW
jgi:hypothetical protein